MQYVIERTLSEALYGQVLLARESTSKQLVAIKKVCLTAASLHMTIGDKRRRVSEDIDIEKHVNQLLSARGGHPNIVRMRSTFVLDGFDHLVFDYCANGDLFSALDNGPLPNAVAKRYLRQIASGLAYMHAHGVAHRDLSLENILIDGDTCRICDFGLATPMSMYCSDKVGKDFYMAPEIAQGGSYDPAKVDVWSLGIILFMLLTAAPLCFAAIPRDCRFAYFLKHGLRTVLSTWKMHIDEQAVDLLEKMLEPCPGMRISLEDVLSHDYLTQQPDKPPSNNKALALINRFFNRPVEAVATL